MRTARTPAPAAVAGAGVLAGNEALPVRRLVRVLRRLVLVLVEVEVGPAHAGRARAGPDESGVVDVDSSRRTVSLTRRAWVTGRLLISTSSTTRGSRWTSTSSAITGTWIVSRTASTWMPPAACAASAEWWSRRLSPVLHRTEARGVRDARCRSLAPRRRSFAAPSAASRLIPAGPSPRRAGDGRTPRCMDNLNEESSWVG